jgi:hypothetical protein
MSKLIRKRRKRPSLRRRAAASFEKHVISNALLQPWFLNMDNAKAIQRLIPRKYFSRMRWFFDDYGCLRCKRKRILYSGNGLCTLCRHIVIRQLGYSMKRRLKNFREPEPPNPKTWYPARAEAAENLLADLTCGKK